jgi:hypothetical protein
MMKPPLSTALEKYLPIPTNPVYRKRAHGPRGSVEFLYD